MRSKLIEWSVALAVVIAGVLGCLLLARHIIGSHCQHYGGDCGPRAPIVTGLLLDSGGRRLHLYAGCGGSLQAMETAARVSLSYTTYRPPAGVGIACAMVDVQANLTRPLGDRQLLDGVSGHRISVLALDDVTGPDPRTARPTGPYRLNAPAGPSTRPAATTLPYFALPSIAQDYRLMAGSAPVTLVRSLSTPVFDQGWTLSRQHLRIAGRAARLWLQVGDPAALVVSWPRAGETLTVIARSLSRPAMSTLVQVAESVRG